MTYKINGHTIHFLEAVGIRSARPIAKTTPNNPPAAPSLLELLAQTKHQPEAV